MHRPALRHRGLPILLLGALTLSACAGSRVPRTIRLGPAPRVGTSPSGPVVPIRREGSVELLGVAYRQEPDGRASGATIPFRIDVRPNPAREVRVAVFEELSNGTGGSWRAATWLAAIQATERLGVSLRDVEISVSTGGRVDGPSAGALMTSGLLATLTGAPVRPDVTMTGTVNPDGSVGPVGGIAYKMEAAARAGKRVFGIPAGLRFETDLASDRSVDLEAHGRRLGLQVVELPHVEAAYELLTGHRLPAAQAVPANMMAPSHRMEQRMRKKIDEWSVLVVEAVRAWENADETTKPWIESDVRGALEHWQRSERYLRQGLVAAAYKSARDAAGMSLPVFRTPTLLGRFLEGDIPGLQAEMSHAAQVEQRIDLFLQQLGQMPLNTVGDVLVVRDASAGAVRAITCMRKAEIERANAEEAFEALGRRGLSEEELDAITSRAMLGTFGAVSWYQTSLFLLATAQETMELRSGDVSDAPVDSARVREQAYATMVAAQAVVEYWEAIFIPEGARYLRTTEDGARAAYFSSDSTYRSAKTALSAATGALEGGSPHDLVLALGTAEDALVDASMLVMRDYSLRVVRDEGRRIVGVERDLALVQALELAEVRARESAGTAHRALGAIPDDVAIPYECARMARTGTVEERLRGLGWLWQAAVASRSASRLGAR